MVDPPDCIAGRAPRHLRRCRRARPPKVCPDGFHIPSRYPRRGCISSRVASRQAVLILWVAVESRIDISSSVAGLFLSSNPSGIAGRRKGRCTSRHEHQIARGHFRQQYRGAKYALRAHGKPPGRLSARRTAPKPKPGRSGWRATAGRRSRRRRSRNGSAAVTAGCRSNVIAAKPRLVFPSNTSAGRGTRRSGNSRRH